MKSLVIVPTYNERENIVSLVRDILQVGPSCDVLIVDDNSPDGTGVIADELAGDTPAIHVLHRSRKMGLGTAYILGFEYALAKGYDAALEMDADYSHNPHDLPGLVAAAEAADVVIGSRYVPGGGTPDWPTIRRLVSGGGNAFARTVLGIPVFDCTGGFRCYRAAALRKINLKAIHAKGYAFQIEMTYHCWREGLQICEVPIVFQDRRAGRSKMSRRIIAEALWWVVSTRLNPRSYRPR